MDDSNSTRSDYRIEISGWGLDHGFFTERTELLWTNDGEKQVQLRRALAAGSIVFVRLLSSESSNGSVPVAYQVDAVVPMDRHGRCLMTLAQMPPRLKQSRRLQNASNINEGQSGCDTREAETEIEPEEILR